MNTPTPEDPLPLLEQILADHEEMRTTLTVLQQVLATRLESVARVSEKLAKVSDDVERHFVEEEEAAFVDDVCDEDRVVEEKTREIKKAHDELTNAIQKVIKRFTDQKAQDDWWEEAEHWVDQLHAALDKHSKTTKSVLLDS